MGNNWNILMEVWHGLTYLFLTISFFIPMKTDESREISQEAVMSQAGTGCLDAGTRSPCWSPRHCWLVLQNVTRRQERK